MKRLISLTICLSAFCVVAVAQAPNGQSVTDSQQQATNSPRLEPLSIDDSLSNYYPATVYGGRIDLSPDGELVAYTPGKRMLEPGPRTQFTSSGLARNFTGYTSDVWITNIRTGETIKLAQSKCYSWAPVWSPDGQSLAFFSDRDGVVRLWMWERRTGKTRRVSDVTIRSNWGYQDARWSPDGKQILVSVLNLNTPILGYAPGQTAAGWPLAADRVSDASIRIFEWPVPGRQAGVSKEGQRIVEKVDSTDIYYVDLALIDVATGKYRRIVEGVCAANYRFNPQGDQILYISRTKQEASTPANSFFDLVVFSLRDGQSRTVLRDIAQNKQFYAANWSPDGKRIALMDKAGEVSIVSAVDGSVIRSKRRLTPDFSRAPLWDDDGRFVYGESQDTVWRIDSNDGTAKELAKISNHTIRGMPSFANSGRIWSPAGSGSLIVNTQDDDSRKTGFYSIDLANGKSSVLFEADKSIAHLWNIEFQVGVNDDGHRVAFTLEDSQHPQEVWMADSGFREMRQVTHINQALEHRVFGQAQVIQWNASDGRSLRGALVLPAGYEKGKRYPLVVYSYGGFSNSKQAYNFYSEFQVFATRGYAVLLPDLQFENKGTPMYDLAQSLLPGINKVIELGIADPERLALWGQSIGGYSALALIAQTKRFKAAVVQSGFGNLVSLYGVLRKDGEDFGIGVLEGLMGLGGPPWQFQQRFIENSPIFYLDRVETPVLLIYGTADDAVPPFIGEEIFVGLRRLGKTVTLVEYGGGEGHGVMKRENIIDWWNRTFGFFDKYLGPNVAERKEASRK